MSDSESLTFSSILNTKVGGTSTFGGTDLEGHSNIVNECCARQGTNTNALGVTSLKAVSPDYGLDSENG